MTRNFKIFGLIVAFFLAGALLIVNVLSLDLNGSTLMNDIDFKEEIGVTQTTKRLVAERGNITDSEGNLIATDVKVYKVYFVLSDTQKIKRKDADGNVIEIPLYVVDKRNTAKIVAEYLKADEDYIYERLCQKRYQVEIGTAGSNIPYDVKNAIQALNLPGVYFTESSSRYYSYSGMASHLIGYVKKDIIDNEVVLSGIAGIERELNSNLSGKDGTSIFYSDVTNNIISGGLISKEEAESGLNVQLTLNKRIQQSLDTMLDKMMNLSDVDKAWGVVLNAKTGAILGYDSYPTFDPNVMDITDYNDYVSALPYEPGSTMKAMTYAMAIDLGEFNPNATFNSNHYYLASDKEGQPVRVNPSEKKYIGVIHNSGHGQYGVVDFEVGFIRSLNVGTVTLLEQQIGKENFINYLDAFGFYKKVDVLGINEGNDYGRADYSNAFNLACASFGSGNTCTALQMLQAYTAFTNDGEMIKPYIVQSITDPVTNEIVYEGQREVVGQPIKASTAKEVLRLMYQTVNTGIHKSAYTLRIPNCSVGCKTGTAPVANASGGYSANTVIHSVMITMPAENPEVLIYVAYQDNKQTQRNFKYIRDLEIVIANTLDLNVEQEEQQEVVRELIDLPYVVNHTVTYVKNKNDLKNLDLIFIGDGDTIIKQFPFSGNQILSDQRLILLTNGQEIMLPDFSNWSRNEIIAFAEMANITINIEGTGFGYSQSVKPKTIIDESTIVDVILK